MEATLSEKIALFLVLIGSLSVHEWAHAFAADKMGDPTPRAQGRLTLNPLAHIDMLGTVIIPLTMILLAPGFVILGWGKPVIIDPKNFKNPALGDILTSMAGPLSNLILALIVASVFGVSLGFMHDGETAEKVGNLGVQIIALNAMLAAFNLIPIPPLDGSHVLRYLVGMSEMAFFKFAQWGSLILIILINIDAFQVLLGKLITLLSVPFIGIMELMAGLMTKAAGA